MARGDCTAPAHRVAWLVVGAISAAACGRIGFGARADADAGSAAPVDSGGIDSAPPLTSGQFTQLALPSGGSIGQVATTADGATRYALAWEGPLYRSTDGATWSRCNDQLLLAIAVDGAGTVYGAGDHDVYASTDACATWQAMGLGKRATGVNVTSGTLYAMNSWLYAYGTGGWTHVATPLDGSYDASAFDAVGSSALLGTYGSGVARLGSGGTWVASTTGLATGIISAIAIAPSQPTTVYAMEDTSATAFGDLTMSTDGGATWTQLYDNGGNAVAVDPADPQHVIFAPYEELGELADGSAVNTDLRGPMAPIAPYGFAFEPNGHVLAATQDGVWERAGAPYTTGWVQSTAGLQAWQTNAIVGTSAGLYLATDSGVFRPAGTSFALGNAGFPFDSAAYGLVVLGDTLVAAGRVLTRSTDGGATWTVAYDAEAMDNYGVYGVATDGTRVFAGTGTEMLYADPPYTAWTRVAVTGNPNTRGFAYGGGNVWAATDQGLFVSTDRGVSYSHIDAVAADDTTSVVALADGTVVAATDSEGLFVGSAGAASWANPLTPTNAILAVCANATTVAVVTHGESVEITHDEGVTWTVLSGLEDRYPISCGFDAITGALIVGTAGDGVWQTPAP